jgi:hypothetical protein
MSRQVHHHAFTYTGTHADCDCGFTFQQFLDGLNGVKV